MRASLAIICALVAVAVATEGSSYQAVSFSVDLTDTSEWEHYWERCVGSGHAALALRQDWRDQLAQTQQDLGVERVRFHGILDDDVGVYSIVQGAPAFSFINTDSIFDFLLSINMQPIVELSFMPDVLASGNTTIFHYKGNTTPPKNYSAWEMVITTFVQHLVDRYTLAEVAQWHFEVWNEPNCGFWTPGPGEDVQTTYFTLYQHTANAVKAVDSSLQVGGPVTCSSHWIPEFLEFCNDNDVPVDFVSTHQYPTDIEPIELYTFVDTLKNTSLQVGNLPLLYTEYNDGLYFDPPQHDLSYAAAFTMFTIPAAYGVVDLMSFWTFSDIFEEQGWNPVPFMALSGFGMQNWYGVPKPVYRAFQLLHQSGSVRANTTASLVYPDTTVGAFATLTTEIGSSSSGANEMMIVVYNHDVLGNTINTWDFTVSVSGANIAGNPTITRIDSTHSNPVAAWNNMGNPAYPTAEQLEALFQASELVSDNVAFSIDTVNGAPQTTFGPLTIEPQGVAVIRVTVSA